MPETVGEILRKARNERKISLDQAAQATRIRVRYLEALENDMHNAMPSEVQGRGFLRLYADYLGLPEQPLLNAWAGKLPEPPPPPPDEIEPAIEGSPSDNSGEVEDHPEIDDGAIIHAEGTTSSGDVIFEEDVPQSIRIFREVGNTLRKQREHLGISLDDVERYTHIRRHYLEAMEFGQMDHLPSPVQGQGMLNNYARFIEVNSDALLLHYADGLQAHRLEKVAELSVSKKRKDSADQPGKRPGIRQFITLDMVIGVSIILLVFAAGIWSLAQITDNNHLPQATAPSMVDILISTPATLLAPVQIATAETTRIYSGELVDQPAQKPGEIFTGNETPTPPSPIDSSPLQISITANQRAWMKIIADDKTVFNGRVEPNKSYAFSANKKIDLATGNAAAIQLKFNQNDLGILGVVGQVVNMTFTLEGIITPTALPTPTGTATQPTTPTLTAPIPTAATPTVTPFIP